MVYICLYIYIYETDLHIVHNTYIYIHIYICISYVNDMYTSIVNVSTRTSQNGARKRPTEDRYLSLSLHIHIYIHIYI